jgi:hypothetical protein
MKKKKVKKSKCEAALIINKERKKAHEVHLLLR